MMKETKKILAFFALIQLATLFGCGKDESVTQSEEELQTEKLAHSWIVGDNSTVKRNSDDLTTKYAEFVLRFTKSGAYSIVGDQQNIFFPSGKWEFVDDTYKKVSLNKDEISIDVSLDEERQLLTLTFNLQENKLIGGGRVAGITGEYTFVLDKKK